MDKQQRVLRARIAAHTSWANTVDRTARTEKARRTFADRFLDQVPPEITDPVERAKAADNLRKAHYIRMALKSAQARKKSTPAVVGADNS